MKKESTGWTTPADIKAQVLKLWNRGTILTAMAESEPLFPLRLTLKGPNSRQLSDRFAEVRDWITQLTAATEPYRITWRTVNHRVLGSNDLPSELWIDTENDALALIGKHRDAADFASMIELTRKRKPALLPWLSKRPLRALELAESWPNMLHLVAWLRERPRPAIYLRQIDLPGVHTNFLAFPPVPRAMVIFGAGYGFRNLARIDWLQTRKLHYWGDIDTHGFAILNQFREHFPHATSLLMDRATLLAHRNHWQTEPHPESAELTRLTDAEQSLYDDLRSNRLGDSVRLEQEKIGFETLLDSLKTLP